MYSFIVLPALALYLYLAWKAMGAAYRSTRHPVLKFAYPAVALAVLAVLPFADIIYPRWKLAQLCATEAKTELLAMAKLPVEYFNSDGTLLFRNGNPLNIDWDRLKPILKLQVTGAEVGSSAVRRISEAVIDVRSGRPLLVRSWFSYSGGWLGFTNTGFGKASCAPPVALQQEVMAVVGKAE